MKTDIPIISVIIPVFNSAPYISECISSIANQRIENIEIICVDDGSSDGSLKILKDCKKKDRRIRVVAKSNEGVNYARRDGLKIARGKWVAFIDADDLISANYFEVLMSAASAGVDVVIGGARVVENRHLPVSKSVGSISLISSKEEVYRLFIRQWVAYEKESYYIPISPWAKLIRRDLLLKNDWYKSNYSSGNDSLMMRQVFQNMNNELALVSEPIYYYYVEPNSGSLATKKSITTNSGKKISRLDYEVERYATDLKYVNKMKYNLDYDIAINKIGSLYNHLLKYVELNNFTDKDAIVINQEIKKMKLDFADPRIGDAISRNEFDFSLIKNFYNTVRNGGVEEYVFNNLLHENEADSVLAFAKPDEVPTSLVNITTNRFHRLIDTVRNRIK